MVKEMGDKELCELYYHLFQRVEVTGTGRVEDLKRYLEAKEEIGHRGLFVLCDPLDAALGMVVCE